MGKRGKWPDAGRVDANLRVHCSNLRTEIEAIQKFATDVPTGKDAKPIPLSIWKPLFSSLIKILIKIDVEAPIATEIKSAMEEIALKMDTIDRKIDRV
jgi:hypothetical protein